MTIHQIIEVGGFIGDVLTYFVKCLEIYSFVGKPDEPVECQNCNRVYKNRSCLSSHMSQDCGKNARFECPLCRYFFKRKHNLKQHLLGKHGLANMNELISK